MGLNNKTIVVIGNGTSILDYKFGNLIDSFTDVVRFNDYVISGFEEYIGLKTTIWARSNSKRTKDRDWSQFKRVIIASPEWNFKTTNNIPQGRNNYYIISKDQSFSLQEKLNLPGRIVKKGYPSKRGWPSTGLLTLNYLLNEYSEIYIYGFDCFDKKGNKYAKHYYNNDDMTQCYVHDTNKEKQWLNEYINNKRLIPLTACLE